MLMGVSVSDETPFLHEEAKGQKMSYQRRTITVFSTDKSASWPVNQTPPMPLLRTVGHQR